MICGWWENGQGYHLAICRNDSLNQDIFKDTKNNEIRIHYLRQLMFEKCITHTGRPMPGPQQWSAYFTDNMPLCWPEHDNNRLLGAQRVMLWFFVNFRCQLSLILNLNLIDSFTMSNGLIQRIILAICKMLIALAIFPSSTNQTFSQSSNESAQPLSHDLRHGSM